MSLRHLSIQVLSLLFSLEISYNKFTEIFTSTSAFTTVLLFNMQLPSRAQPPAERAAALVRLMEENAQGDYIGESISQLEHSLQCAHLAAKAGKR